MKSLNKIMIAAVLVLLSSVSLNAQIKNEKTAEVKISGNCGMCKKNIEKAANVNKESAVVWDTKTKIAKISYDSTKTNQDAILKRIANAGYDSEKFKATEEQYNKLSKCCQYDREAATSTETDKTEKKENHEEHKH